MPSVAFIHRHAGYTGLFYVLAWQNSPKNLIFVSSNHIIHMTKHITIRSSEMDMAKIDAIRQAYGDVNLIIQIAPVDDAAALTDEDCWALIARLDWDAGGEDESEDEAIVAPLLQALADSSISHIYQFADWLAEQLWKLDTPAHAENLIEEDGFLSVDDFLYARCAVVANGADFYRAVLDDPSLFPATVTFSALLYLPQDAFKRKTGQDMVYIPPFDYETYGNKAAWG